MVEFVCPDTKSPLKEANGKLVSEEGVEYDFVYGIPLLVNRKNLPDDYAEKGEKAFARVTDDGGTTWNEIAKFAVPTTSYQDMWL